MKTIIAGVAALVYVTFVAISAPRADVTTYRYGLTGNDWWDGRYHNHASPAALHDGQ